MIISNNNHNTMENDILKMDYHSDYPQYINF
jgi:hypothetical protein